MKTEKRVEDFIKDLIQVYKKHQMSLGHEDEQGAFIVEPLSEINEKWLKNCQIRIKRV